MIRQIPYYNPISADNALYSIDNLKIIFQARENFAEGLRLDDNYFNTIFPFAKSHGISHRNNEYYQTYNIGFGLSSITVKLLLNSPFCCNRCCIEVNPNKCFDDEHCIDSLKKILLMSEEFYIKTFDVAIDVPLPITMFRMDKDKRRKISMQYNKINSTDYCGTRGTAGYCKIYDKKKESKLDYECTRIEITFGNPLDDDFLKTLVNKLPKIKMKSSEYISQAGNVKLSSTDKVLLALFDKIDDDEFKSIQFKQLDRKKQQRLKPMVYSDEIDYMFDVSIIEKLALSIVANSDFIPECFAVAGKIFINQKGESA